ncbi:Flavohemoprotein [Vibrio stylophorae]|uniref:Flavohemoprotein n=1 Tax=Vibrio stylophorae TaxID=659351 RepID=A0ABM8ZT22_9VIBR|nr:MOSC N-terminal beta barrel domain-containing protein [Vibrio stylophorae]CAH0533443.1 Flavohemoprotein [Vibrio stylophorae]
MLIPKLSDIFIYPIKSAAATSQNHAQVTLEGLCHDRRFMLMGVQGEMITARQFPVLIGVQVQFDGQTLTISAPSQAPISMMREQWQLTAKTAQIWHDTFTAYHCHASLDQWFSQLLNHPVSLLYCGEQSQRYRDKLKRSINLADSSPISLISQASLDALNTHSPLPQQMLQFRPNLVVEGCDAFAEDSWQQIQIGEVIFDVRAPIMRCAMTQIDPISALVQTDNEPMKTLATFRANSKGEVYFGQKLVAQNTGTISMGDPIQVLSKKTPISLSAANRIINPSRTVNPSLTVSPSRSDAPETPKQLPSMNIRCTDKKRIAPHFYQFEFVVETSSRKGSQRHHSLAFQAGQFVSLNVPIQGQSHQRSYSVSQWQQNKVSGEIRFQLMIKRVDHGLVSNWLIDQLKPKDRLQASAPQGEFCLQREPSPVLLMSAGSGITPMLAMLTQLLAEMHNRDVIFYYLCHQESDAAVLSHLHSLAAQHPQFDLRLALSKPTQPWTGLTGRLNLGHIRALPDLKSFQIYLCGPNGFMEKAQQLLLRQGVAQNQIHQEFFQTSTPTGAKQDCSIQFDGFRFMGNNQASLLLQLEQQGLQLAHSCRSGFCGACKVTIREGKVNHGHSQALTPEEIAQGQALACCCIPLTDIVVER